MRRAFLCDFDGTISPTDIGAALVERFSPGAGRERAALLARWAGGELGHRELTVAEFDLVRVSEPEARAFARGFAIDPHFARFAAEMLARGDAVMVVSEGLDFYVADHLGRAGVGELPWAANHARFEGDRLIPEFPWSAGGCGRCGNCKAQHARRYRARGYQVVAVGDGLSDRCAAAEADVVLARGALLEWCRARGLAALPFADFADVAARVRSGLVNGRVA
jgi:2,3-diketo-5-methylthio-1-phosphopentane phosphatase